MSQLIENAGIFAWPLLVCSVLGCFVALERLVALRRSRIIPSTLLSSFTEGKIPEAEGNASVAARILSAFHNDANDVEQLKAFARMEVSRMERGLFILEIIVSAAPLLGLLGTVTGLVKVFGKISPETGLPDPSSFVEGVSLALTTTMMGLSIAIPALVFLSFLNRKIDTLSSELSVVIERLVATKSEPSK